MSTIGDLPKRQRAAMREAKRCHRHGWSTITGRLLRLATMRRLIGKGLMVEDAEPCVVVDGDGWMVIPERYGAGYSLTPAGLAAFAEEDAQSRQAVAS